MVACGPITLFNDLIAGVVDDPKDKCSKQLHVQYDKSLDAGVLDIATIAVTSLPDNVETLDLSYSKLTKVPSFQASHLKEIMLYHTDLLTSLAEVHVPPSLETLDVTDCKIKAIDRFAPGFNVSTLYADGNPIERLTNVTLPSSITKLYLTRTKITEVKGVGFPPNLQFLDLRQSPVKVIEIAQHDVKRFSKMVRFAADVSMSSCENPKAKVQFVQSVSVCVLADKDWIAAYPEVAATVSFPADLQSSSQSGTSEGLPSALPKPHESAGDNSKPSSGQTHSVSLHSSKTPLEILLSIAVPAILVVIGVLIRNKCCPRRPPTPDVGNAHHTQHNNEHESDADYRKHKDQDEFQQVPVTAGSSSEANSTATNGQPIPVKYLQSLSDPSILARRVPTNALKQREKIGNGAFGEVFKGSLHGRVVAIKRVSAVDDATMQSFAGELHLVSQLHHFNLVELIGVAWDSESLASLCAVYEYMSVGDLRDLLVKFEESGRAQGFDDEKLRIALDVAKGLQYLHTQTPKVIHRDLKSRNVLLNADMTAKLGVSRRTSEQTLTLTAGKGTHLWMAPEVLLGQRYNEKADIFSFGVVLSELDTHLLPYSDALTEQQDAFGHQLPEFAILHQVALGSRHVTFSQRTSPSHQDTVALGNACIAVDPAERPTAAEIVDRLNVLLS